MSFSYLPPSYFLNLGLIVSQAYNCLADVHPTANNTIPTFSPPTYRAIAFTPYFCKNAGLLTNL